MQYIVHNLYSGSPIERWIYVHTVAAAATTNEIYVIVCTLH